MGLTRNKVKQLEDKLHKRSQQHSENKLQIPKNWEDFVGLTTIRSGGQMKKFELYEYQKIIVSLAREFPNMVILKSRQMGITQCIVSKFLHDACVNPAASSILFMRNAEDASAVSRRARQMLLSIQEYAHADNDNVGYLKISNGGDLYFKNSGKEGSRSLDSATGMLFDEAAFVEGIERIYSASSPSSALSGDKIQKFIVSTPSAKSGFYWTKLNENNGIIDIEQLAKDVAEGKTHKQIPGVYWFIDNANCCKLILHWSAHPIYSKIPNYLEYRLKQDGTDEETVAREYDLQFIDSAVSVFNADLVQRNAIGVAENIRDVNVEYYCGLDTSTFGSDYTSFVVLKYANGEYSLVSFYRKRQETSQFHLYQIGKLIDQFKPEIVAVEVTGGTGELYVEQLSRHHRNTVFEKIRTTSDSKANMVANLVLAMEREVLRYPPGNPLVDEMLSFRRQGRKLEASPGKHDDVLMSTAFALTVSPFCIQKSSIFDLSKIRIG